MAKAKKKPTKKLTKKQLSRRHREERQLRLIWMSVGILVVLMIAIIAAGLIAQNSRAVAWVNGQKISVNEYQKRVRFTYNYYNYLAPGYMDSLQPEQRDQFYQPIADELIEDTLIRQEAEKKGLSVSDEEIQIEIEETWFQHYRTPPTPSPSPTPDPQEEQDTDSTPLPTPTPDTEEAFQTNYEAFVNDVLKPARISEAYFREIVEASLLREKLALALVPEVPQEEDQVNFLYMAAMDDQDARTKIESIQTGVAEQVNARHILVETEEEANAVLQRLQAGEDFAVIAAEVSIDTSNKDQGGELGWFGRGQMVPEFEEAAFEADIGLYPTPIQTDFGYHILEVLGHEDRPFNAEEELTEAGWYGKQQLATRFGPLFAEMLFNAELGLFPEPVPTEYGVLVVELVDRQVRTLDQEAQAARRAELFQSRLDEIREEGDIQNLWKIDMVPSNL